MKIGACCWWVWQPAWVPTFWGPPQCPWHMHEMQPPRLKTPYMHTHAHSQATKRRNTGARTASASTHGSACRHAQR